MIFYIKGLNGIPFSEDACAAWYGLVQAGSRVRFYEHIHDVPVNRSHCVIGDIEDTEFYFVMLQLYPEKDIRFPIKLKYKKEFWKREIESGQTFPNTPFPKFIKPYWKLKEFEPFIAKNYKEAMDKGSNFLNIISEPVKFLTEYRCFILEKELIGAQFYAGDQNLMPNLKLIPKIISEYSNAPVAYTCDLGVLDNGETAIVEFNDAWACGCYGLEPRLYARWLKARWIEILTQNPI